MLDRLCREQDATIARLNRQRLGTGVPPSMLPITTSPTTSTPTTPRTFRASIRSALSPRSNRTGGVRRRPMPTSW
jgi:hypothetical protein